MDTNCNGAEIQYSTNNPTLEHYTACIKANFQGFIEFTTHDNEAEDLDDNESRSNVKLRNTVGSSATNGCKLSVSTTTEGVKLSPISPHNLKEKKHISTSTGFLKEIIDTQEVLDKVYKSGSSKSVNFSDIKSKCDFRVATACFSNIRCLNPSVQYVRKISKESGSSNGISAETSSTVSTNEVQLNIKVKTAKVEQWLSQVLPLLNKEYIIDSTSSPSFKIVLPLRNKLSNTLIDPIEGPHSYSNAILNKKSDVAAEKCDNLSMKKVIINFIFTIIFILYFHLFCSITII